MRLDRPREAEIQAFHDQGGRRVYSHDTVQCGVDPRLQHPSNTGHEAPVALPTPSARGSLASRNSDGGLDQS